MPQRRLPARQEAQKEPERLIRMYIISHSDEFTMAERLIVRILDIRNEEMVSAIQQKF